MKQGGKGFNFKYNREKIKLKLEIIKKQQRNALSFKALWNLIQPNLFYPRYLERVDFRAKNRG